MAYWYKISHYLAKTLLLADPLSYYSSNISTSEAYKKLLDFSPLIGNLIQSIVIQSIYVSLTALCFDKLGYLYPGTGSQFHSRPSFATLVTAIQAFKPELEWLNKNTQALRAIKSSVERFDAFFPILGKIQTNDSKNLAPIIKYLYSDTFIKAMCH
ncbi:hypothetical protein BJ085DRAFT_32453 [Dimargaris cristalligena]|uniref:Uncharacterized protein n=1 Tax=Dimargaris cristalligena TaxID=215637 RepID=A0A4P9ZPJ9_9FUNG|nr:hypothetical protein BJ085DRAFT_32453 [Dimargaris cristalligena]|eukprot:RKP34512.1 hypothetical protein BJ085DRAFT_32453 [Dimargaris cristalligena]